MESAKLCAIYVCIFAMFACNHALGEEPTYYSKYDFEEKVLEKLVRTENKMELYEKRMQEMTNTFKEDRETMHGTIDTFKSENSDVAQKMADIEEKNDRMTQDVVAMEMRMYQVLNATLQKALADAQNIAEQASVPAVAFHAKDVTNVNPATGERLIFPTTIVNRGDGYDPSTGTFTAKVRGIYVFSVQISMDSSQAIYAAIKKNDDVLAAFIVGQSGWRSSTGSFAVTELDVGDIVSVVKTAAYAGGAILSSTTAWTSFSGTLVNAIH